MDIVGITCYGCGSSNIEIDHSRKIICCNTCGGEYAFNRSTLNKNGKVVFSNENAMAFFKAGKYEDAKKYAHDVLNVSKDNATALFIMAFTEEFVERKSNSMKNFFEESIKIDLEYDEIESLRTLFVQAAPRMIDFEADIIKLMATNLQAQEDKKRLNDFIDQICPYFISKRTSSLYLTPELVEMYTDLAKHCGIPKTCFALLKSIETNPDSPYITNSFYLESKTNRFYNDYILQIGDIIDGMCLQEFKQKFMTAFLQKREKYEIDAKIK